METKKKPMKKPEEKRETKKKWYSRKWYTTELVAILKAHTYTKKMSWDVDSEFIFI
jgi:hypothetical protein